MADYKANTVGYTVKPAQYNHPWGWPKVITLSR